MPNTPGTPSRTARLPLVAAIAIAAVLAIPTVACSSKDDAGAVTVTATDAGCELSRTALSSGTTTFRVTNKGKKVTEVYVYGDGDRILGERENIAPGTGGDLTVKLGRGSYEVACKPGQTGDGIRTPITVTGSAAAAPTVDRTIRVRAFDYGYQGLDDLQITQGETIRFELTNTATTEQHELEIKRPDGDVLGEIGPTDPGKDGSVVLTFEDAGTYRYACGITGHEAMGMKGTFVVAAA